MYLAERKIRPTGHVEQHPAGPVQGSVEQRVGECGPGSLGGRSPTPTVADRHERGATARHHCLHVSEVDVDHSADCNDVGDALHSLAQYLVSKPERLFELHAALQRRQQPVVIDNDEGIHLLLQLAQPLVRICPALRSLEPERQGHHADGQRTLLAREVRHQRCRSSARPAAHSSGDEDHVGALEQTPHLCLALAHRLAAHLGLPS